MPKIVSMLLNHKRPGNMPRIIEAIRAQTLPSTIIVLNNQATEVVKGDITITSDFNFNCLPRFFIPGWLECDYVWQNDDDHYIGENNFFEKLVAESQANPDRALLWNGRVLAAGEKSYQAGQGVERPQDVNVGNWGFSFYHSSVGSRMSNHGYTELSWDEMKYADDLYASWCCPCRVSEHIKKGMVKMDEGTDSITLSKNHLHMDMRNQVGKKLFTSRNIF